MSSPGSVEHAQYQAARDRVSLPAIFLIIIGGLNLILGGIAAWIGFSTMGQSEAEIGETVILHWEALTPPQQERLRGMSVVPESDDLYVELGHTLLLAGKDAEFGSFFRAVLENIAKPALILGLTGTLGAALTMFAGFRMLRMKSYRLAVLMSVFAAIPGQSLTACIGIGIVVGMWSLVVLLSSEVKNAFRMVAASADPTQVGPPSSPI